MKRITGICIITRDVSRLCAFYRDVLKADSEGDEIFSSLRAEGTQLSLCDEQIMEQMAPNSMVGAGRGSYTLEVQVDDVDSEYRRLADGHVDIVKAPTTQPWCRRSVWFRDPDGNLINFYAQVSSGDS